MKTYENDPLTVSAARETIRMHNELLRLRDELDELLEYKQKYMDLLNESVAHSGHMLGGMLELAMTPGVLDACKNAKSETPAFNPEAK